MKRRVLFLCATNSFLGPMAEALLRHIDALNFEPFSAGMRGESLHPLAIETMREIGIALDQKSPKVVEEVRDQVFDLVIALDEITAGQSFCLQTRETVHWKFDNPLAGSNPDAQRRAFRSVCDQIAQRLRLFAIVHVRPALTERTRIAQDQNNPWIQAR